MPECVVALAVQCHRHPDPARAVDDTAVVDHAVIAHFRRAVHGLAPRAPVVVGCGENRHAGHKALFVHVFSEIHDAKLPVRHKKNGRRHDILCGGIAFDQHHGLRPAFALIGRPAAADARIRVVAPVGIDILCVRKEDPPVRKAREGGFAVSRIILPRREKERLMSDLLHHQNPVSFSFFSSYWNFQHKSSGALFLLSPFLWIFPRASVIMKAVNQLLGAVLWSLRGKSLLLRAKTSASTAA